MNTLHIIGSVGSNPDMRTTPQGTPVCTFNVAVNERKGTNEITTWFRVTTWAKLAETCNRYITKGRLVEVTGSVSANAFTRKDGTVACSIEINAKEVEFLGGKKEESKEQPSIPQGFVKVDDDPDFLPF
jgi:single-strand DNA-binding protein